ncbi:MAG TPA: tRNA lysidine(34) synthetase TilS [bacterium]|nr:tRNA lysidine(34) synthetase TilS [bacterium]
MAVSGGVDSVVLLHLLRFLPPKLRPRLFAAHFHHNLRGRAADADARFVRELCRSWDVPLKTGKAPRWKTRENTESRARDLRYRFLVREAARIGARKIATAHHADDQLETFVMRWLQGAGLKGLSGIRPVRPWGKRGRVALVRPLLRATRPEIAAYARALKLRFREDATNASDLYLRSRLRKLLKALRKENPNLSERTATNAVFLQADDDRLNDEILAIFRKVAVRSSGKVACPVFKYRLMPPSLRYRLLQKMAQQLAGDGFALPAVSVLKVDEILRDSAQGQVYDLPAGLGFEKQRKHFVFFRKSR